MMDVDFIRKCCMAQPHTTETVQWGYDLVFKVGGKMYAVTPLEPAPVCLSFKCTPEDFAKVRSRILKSYQPVRSKLPRKTQLELSARKAG